MTPCTLSQLRLSLVCGGRDKPPRQRAPRRLCRTAVLHLPERWPLGCAAPHRPHPGSCTLLRCASTLALVDRETLSGPSEETRADPMPGSSRQNDEPGSASVPSGGAGGATSAPDTRGVRHARALIPASSLALLLLSPLPASQPLACSHPTTHGPTGVRPPCTESTWPGHSLGRRGREPAFRRPCDGGHR